MPIPNPRAGVVATIVPLVMITVAGEAGAASNGCFVERARTPIAHPGQPSASGRLVATVQRGNWDTRPAIRIARVGPSGTMETGVWEAEWYVSDVHLAADLAVVAADFGIVTLDLSDPRHPVELDALDLLGADVLAVDGNSAYIATTGASLNGWFDVIDLSDPAELAQGNRLYWDRPDPVKRAVAARGGTAIIADDEGLLVIDVDRPLLPQPGGRWSRVGVRDVAMVGPWAVAAVTSFTDPNDHHIEIVDVSDRDAPVSLGSWPTPSAALTVAGYGTSVLVGTESHGVLLLDIADPADPVPIDGWQLPGVSVSHLATARPTVVLTDDSVGTVVLGLDPSCLGPRRPSGRVGF